VIYFKQRNIEYNIKENLKDQRIIKLVFSLNLFVRQVRGIFKSLTGGTMADIQRGDVNAILLKLYKIYQYPSKLHDITKR
jgi:hypothetical protein